MARQGKLHSSPFHIETPWYKYAVEHETADCIRNDGPARCPWMDRETEACKLWNCAFYRSRCREQKCLYWRYWKKSQYRDFWNESPRRRRVCSACRFRGPEGCTCPDYPRESKQPWNGSAPYCRFYAQSEEAADRERQELQVLQARLAKLQEKYAAQQETVRCCRNQVLKLRRQIKAKKKWRGAPDCPGEKKRRLLEEIRGKKAELQEAERQQELAERRRKDTGHKLKELKGRMAQLDPERQKQEGAAPETRKRSKKTK